MGSDIFFHGLAEGETCEVKIAEGKELIIKLIHAGDGDGAGFRDVVFEVNGSRTAVRIRDKDAGIASEISQILYADEEDLTEIGANIPGNILKVLVEEGEEIREKQPLAVIEAMKMETNILSPMNGTVDKIYVQEGQQVKTGQLIVKLK